MTQNPYEPPASDLGGKLIQPANIRTWATRVGWLNIIGGPSFTFLVTIYYLSDDISMGAVLWLLSLPIAVVAYVVPGIVLLRHPRAGWLLQPLPIAVTWYASKLLRDVLRLL